jgi:hypothetical protein
MDNGNSINPGDMMYGAQIPQSVIGMQRPEHNNQYFLFSVEGGPGFPYGKRLHCNTIDMLQNNGLGKVIDKRKIIIEDSLSWGGITGCKHANGRDWWIHISKHAGEGYYSVAMLPDTMIVFEYTYEIPHTQKGGGGLAFRLTALNLSISYMFSLTNYPILCFLILTDAQDN